MYRIIAINEDIDSEDEDDNQVTKEAEETIAASEYMRALKFMKEGHNDEALSLLTELLEAKVIFEVTKENKTKTLYSVKYNCYKNIGVIYESRGKCQEALDYYTKAVELDDSDIYTMNKLGQLALSMGRLETAQVAFEKCLKKNPNHWPSGDGILQILCQREDYNEAYGWALKWYDKNNNYERGLDVILEVREKFAGLGMNYLENCWSIKFKDKSLTRTNPESMFPPQSYYELEPLVEPDIEQFKVNSIEDLNWLTMGKLIANMYEHFKSIGVSGISYEFDFEQLFLKKTESTAEPMEQEIDENSGAEVKTTEIAVKAENDVSNNAVADDKQENSNSNADSNKMFSMPLLDGQGTNSAEASADDSDANAKNASGSETASKPKQSRRRGSDLQNLERWAFWKTDRKSSQRQRNKQNGRNEVDTSINGVLRKILAKYFEDNFDNEAPFDPDGKVAESEKSKAPKTVNQPMSNGENFLEETADSFAEFINELKTSGFCVIQLLFKWPQYISKYWEKPMPTELRDVYLKIYRFYLNHYDLNTWTLLDVSDFQAAYRMTLMYLELDHERALELDSFNANCKNEVDSQWFLLYNHLIFQSGFYDHSDDAVENSKCQKRLYWLQYCLARYEYDLDRAVSCLCTIRDILAQHCDTYRLEFPNQRHNRRIDLATVNAMIVTFERIISLNSVQDLYARSKFEELIVILRESLVHATINTDSDEEKPVLKITTQFEVILECFWSLERYEECLIWAERSLKYAFDCYEGASKQSANQKEWASCVTFILTYIETVILEESHLIVSCLDKYYSRLIQTIVRILSNQLDAPFDKNNNPNHPIDIKMPWVILHHVLQRDEDLTQIPKRKLSTDSQNSETGTDEGLDEGIPKSIMVFFTAHEYLGNRSWCTRDWGKLLLYALDVCVPRLRTPYLEIHRYVIAEYLEQITYCLYGYPAKRARLKHIEEHDAQNIELTWKHAIQLFDLFRPDELPEYNSYRNDSITAEMEQLFQRIIDLIPPEINPCLQCADMERFVAGELNELPKALNILPYRINSIYYLLADHYFKNRDFVKSVKYYVPDLSNCPTRFDSWAGLALSKASLLETKLNSCVALSTNEMIQQSEEVLKCFKQCLKIDDQAVSIWIEYGNYAYALHSYCSRSLKQSSDTLSMPRFAFLEEKKEQWLKVAHDCFTTVDQFNENANEEEANSQADESQDEKWLYHYMLGKIGEKRKDPPKTVIDHYLQSAKYLYEHNATYPFRINFTSPQNLSLEALEIFYRVTAVIIKFVEQHSTITRATGKYFIKVLKQLSTSPFAMNQAKINENSINAYKRKISLANEEAAKQKLAKSEQNSQATSAPQENATAVSTTDVPSQPEPMQISEEVPTPAPSIEVEAKNDLTADNTVANKDAKPEVSSTNAVEEKPANQAVASVVAIENVNSPLRRGSQESTATTTTQTTTTTSDSTDSSSDSSTTDSSSSDTDDSSSEDDANKDPDAPMSEGAVENIYKMCIKNLEECVTRFPEHYKSIYRLVLIYLNAPERVKDVKKCQQLLMGTYTTALGNPVQGLFSDRKTNNLFNGIWRNPSSEIDRPGSFSAQLSKCVHILMQILRINVDHKLLLELVVLLQRIPEADKRYIKESERRELLEQAMSFCSQSFKDLLKQHSTDKRDDTELLALLLEIYNAHKKCLKNVAQKDSAFSNVMVDTYKIFIQDKVPRIPENMNFIDLAVKLCVQELNAKKNPAVKRLSLDECGTAGPSSRALNISLPGLNSAIFGSPNNSFSPANELPVASAVPKSMAPTGTVTTTTTSATGPNTGTLPSRYIPGLSRPRGRPPGSKNNNYSSLVPSSSTASLPRLDPSGMSTLMSLYSNPTFMSTLSQFTDPAQLNAFLVEYFRLTNTANASQLMTGLTGQSYLSPTTAAPPAPKPPKAPKLPSSTSTLTISPSGYTNKPVTTVSSNASGTSTVNINSSAANAYKSGASTVISVGSGQLTITPSLSITPNIISQPSVIPAINPPKPRKQAELKRKPSPAVVVPQPKKMCADLTSAKPSLPHDLPKSLSIIPTSSGMANKPIPNLKPVLTMQPEKAAKPHRPKKKATFPIPMSFGGLGNIPGMTKEMLSQYAELVRIDATSSSRSFLSQYEQFCSMVPPGLAAQPSLLKTKVNTSTKAKPSGIGQPQKGLISVKQLETMQSKKRTKPSPKSTPPFQMPSAANKPSSSTLTSSVLNPYSMGLSQALGSLAHSPYISASMLPSSVPSTLQISPTKTLQQKLAEKQRALKDANELTVTISRPSSTSSAGSSKTRKSDNAAEVIILD